MICPKCGRVVPDGTQCPCGAPVLSSNPAVNLIKTLGSSPKFLAAAVLYTVTLVFSILTAVGGSGDVLSELYYIAANYGLDPEACNALLKTLDGAAVISTVIGMIPAILIALGMWMFFGTCRGTQSGNISTGGLTLCRVITAIFAVLYGLLALLVVAAMVLVFVSLGALVYELSSYYEVPSAMFGSLYGIFGVVMVVVILVLALTLALYICAFKTAGRVKASALNGAPDNRVPRYLTVMLMVGGVLGCLGGIVALFGTPTAGIGSIASGVCNILMSLVLSEYRLKMSMLLYPPVQPVYGNVPPQQPGGAPPQQ